MRRKDHAPHRVAGRRTGFNILCRATTNKIRRVPHKRHYDKFFAVVAKSLPASRSIPAPPRRVSLVLKVRQVGPEYLQRRALLADSLVQDVVGGHSEKCPAP